MIPTVEICSDCRNRIHEMPHIEACSCPCHIREIFVRDARPVGPRVTAAQESASYLSASGERRLLAIIGEQAARVQHWKRMTLLFGVLWLATGLAWVCREVWR